MTDAHTSKLDPLISAAALGAGPEVKEFLSALWLDYESQQPDALRHNNCFINMGVEIKEPHALITVRYRLQGASPVMHQFAADMAFIPKFRAAANLPENLAPSAESGDAHLKINGENFLMFIEIMPCLGGFESTFWLHSKG